MRLNAQDRVEHTEAIQQRNKVGSKHHNKQEKDGGIDPSKCPRFLDPPSKPTHLEPSCVCTGMLAHIYRNRVCTYCTP